MLAELLSEVESRIPSFGDGQHDMYTATIGNSGTRVSQAVRTVALFPPRCLPPLRFLRSVRCLADDSELRVRRSLRQHSP
jgi:hypothetical protein